MVTSVNGINIGNINASFKIIYCISTVNIEHMQKPNILVQLD